MFGHECFPVVPLGAPGFWEGAGVVGLGVVAALDGVVLAALDGELVAAAAPLIPAAAPAVASAPATIVAPSILDMFMVRTSWGRLTACAAIVGPVAKRSRSSA
jgi:hypothetical protein